MKQCTICKEKKEFNEFPFQNKKLNKIMSACKVCKSIIQKENRKKLGEIQKQKDRILYQKNKEHRVNYAREYRVKYPERTRATNLKQKYGITQNDYDKMLNLQNNKCAICSRDMGQCGKIFCVDHNHTTGKVRGLLCDPCNYGLGFYEKHKDKYIEYLKKYE
jgi:hypothetical protein